MTQPLLTHSSAAVAALFLGDPRAELYGLEIVEGACSTKGTIYPMLISWEERGWLQSRWETDEELSARSREEPGSRRRYYTLTKRGLAQLTEYLGRWEARQKGRRAAI